MIEQDELLKAIARDLAYWHQVCKNETHQDTSERWSIRAKELLAKVKQHYEQKARYDISVSSLTAPSQKGLDRPAFYPDLDENEPEDHTADEAEYEWKRDMGEQDE